MKLYVRWGDEWHFPQEFIRPNDGMVVEAFDAITEGITSPDEQAIACWNFVTTEIDYPVTLLGEGTDYHLLKAYPLSEGLFGTRFRINLVAEEFFEFPAEVLGQRQKNGRMVADCDGCSLLLGSLLRNALPAEKVRVMVGSSYGSETEADHAWVEAHVFGDWMIMEPTLVSLPQDVLVKARGIAGPMGNGECYRGFLAFNDMDFEERIPLIMNRANELAKLNRISGLWGWPTKFPAEAPRGSIAQRYPTLPEVCVCIECGYEVKNPGVHCPELGPCPRCGAKSLWRVK